MATERGYLNWLAEETPTRWWHDRVTLTNSDAVSAAAHAGHHKPDLSYQTRARTRTRGRMRSPRFRGPLGEELPEAPYVRCHGRR